MTTQRCSACSKVVLQSRDCINCGHSLNTTLVPKRKEELQAQYYDRPISGYLFEHEKQIGLFNCSGINIKYRTRDEWTIKPGFGQKSSVVVSDGRVFAVTSTDSRDQIVSADYRDIVGVSVRSGLRKSSLSLQLVDGVTYTFTLKRASSQKLQSAAKTIREKSAQKDSPKSRATEFIKKVDTAVDHADDAETALLDIAQLFSDRDEETVFDQAVDEAGSLDELLQTLTSSPDVDVPSGLSNDTAASDVELTLQQSSLSNLREQAAYTARNADPAVVGLYAIGAGVGFGTYAISAPFSTALGLGMLATGGALTGAYASAYPDSAVAQIDPIELAISARSRGRLWKRSAAPGGAGTGALIGAIDYTAGKAVPPQYAHWYANTDLDTIMQGAALGARTAENSPNFDGIYSAAILGGGFGLAYGYVDQGGKLGDLEKLLDDDLYEPIRQLEENQDADDN